MISKSDSNLKFVNHACYFVETEKSILICDPWLEGLAFNNGWSLLDNTTSNKEIIQDLISSKKNIFIWFSHEHSDHFSTSFINEFYRLFSSFTVIFQFTLDKRIIKFLDSKNIPSIEAHNGRKIILDSKLSIFVWSHKNGDSFSLVKFKKKAILNLNDCIVDSKKEAKKISSEIKKKSKTIDFLFTQFGYANWIGNKEHQKIRLKAATEKLNRILLQNQYFSPNIIIPFASYINFCDEENFYLNEQQNTPSQVKNSFLLKSIRGKILFLKPRDVINLEKFNKESKDFEILTSKAIEHWEKLFLSIKPIELKKDIVKLDILKKEANKYLNSINKNFLFLPAFLEMFKLLKPVCIYVKDLDMQINFSYLKNFKKSTTQIWDVRLNSEVLFNSLKYEYGFNTLKVNGKFEVNNMSSYKNFIYFFYFQDLFKENITFKNPLNLLKKIMQIAIVYIKNAVSFRI